MKRIILTGGGTAGHVTPNIALLPRLKELGYDIQYIGSYTGIEKELIEPFGIPYHGISSGKLRRYFSVQNFTDPFRVLKGFREAHKLIRQLKPDVIFSKGGFVSVPVVLAGKRCKVPVIIHESDMTPGLANKIAIPSAINSVSLQHPKSAVIFLRRSNLFQRVRQSLQVLRFVRNFCLEIRLQQWICATSHPTNRLSSLSVEVSEL